MIYSIPYFAYLIFLLCLALVEFHCININRGQALTRQLGMLSFVLFFGLRYFVGYDVALYWDDYIKMPYLWQFSLWSTPSVFEFGWKWYTILLKSLLIRYELFVLVNTIIDALLLHLFLKRYTKYYLIGLMVFVAYYGMVLEIEQLRNAKSILLFALSIPYLQQRKALPYILTNALGACFHVSAVLYIVVFPFMHRRLSKVTVWFCFLLPTFIFAFRVGWIHLFLNALSHLSHFRIHEKAEAYMQNTYISGGPLPLSVTMIENALAYFLCVILFEKRLYKTLPTYNLFRNMMVIYYMVFMMLYETSVLAIRISALFFIAFPVLYAGLLGAFSKQAYKVIVLIPMLLLSLLQTKHHTAAPVYKYETIFVHSQTVNQKLQNIANANKKSKQLFEQLNNAAPNSKK